MHSRILGEFHVLDIYSILLLILYRERIYATYILNQASVLHKIFMKNTKFNFFSLRDLLAANSNIIDISHRGLYEQGCMYLLYSLKYCSLMPSLHYP